MDGIGTKPIVDITPADAWAKIIEGMTAEGTEAPEKEAPTAEPEKEAPAKQEPVKEEATDEPDLAAMTVEKLDELIATIQNQGAKKQAESEPQKEAEPDKFLEQLREDNPAMAKLYEEILDIKGRMEARDNAEYQQAVQDEIAVLDKQMEETAAEFNMNAKQAATVIAYMDENPDVARVLSFREATLRVFPDLGKSGAKEAASGDKTTQASTQAKSAKIVSETSNGSAAPQEFKPGPGTDFGDVSSFILKKHFGVRG